MGDTKIEWTDAVWNPVTGCTKVSQGCKHCYAERLAPKVFAGQKVLQHYHELPGTPLERQRVFTDVRCHPERLDAPLHWRKPRRVFVNSMSDLFHEDVPDEFIDKVFAVMARAEQHTFQILTKRPQRMRAYLQQVSDERDMQRWINAAVDMRTGTWPAHIEDLDWPLPNVWLGVSVEDQATARERIPLLLQTPAAVRFLSCEPLLGPINLAPYLLERLGPTYEPSIGWVIAGGESGPGARPAHPDWFRSLRDQCAAAGVPFFFKQWGQHGPNGAGKTAIVGEGLAEYRMVSVGKKAAGRLLDGRTHDEYPR